MSDFRTALPQHATPDATGDTPFMVRQPDASTITVSRTDTGVTASYVQVARAIDRLEIAVSEIVADLTAVNDSLARAHARLDVHVQAIEALGGANPEQRADAE